MHHNHILLLGLSYLYLTLKYVLMYYYDLYCRKGPLNLSKTNITMAWSRGTHKTLLNIANTIYEDIRQEGRKCGSVRIIFCVLTS